VIASEGRPGWAGSERDSSRFSAAVAIPTLTVLQQFDQLQSRRSDKEDGLHSID
jgi:hypothetical protein